MIDIQIETPSWAEPLLTPSRYKAAYGGRGCVHKDTLIDTPNGQIKISDFKGGYVYSYFNGKKVIALANPSIEYKEADLYKIEFDNGKSIITTDQHKLLTNRSWECVGSLSNSSEVLNEIDASSLFLQQSSLVSYLLKLRANVLHWMGIRVDSLENYFLYHHQCDQQPQSFQGNDLVSPPLQDDEQQRNYRASSHLGGQGFEYTNTPSSFCNHPSNLKRLPSCEDKDSSSKESHSDDKFSVWPLGFFQLIWQFLYSNNHFSPFHKLLQLLQDFSILLNPMKILQKLFYMLIYIFLGSSFKIILNKRFNLVKIRQITKHSHQKYWDIHVPIYNNYLSNGIINHNSGKSHFFGELLIEEHVMNQNQSSVCLREVQKTLKQSVKRLLEIKIEKLGVGHYFDVQDTCIKSKYGDGIIIFQGMQNHTADSIKSLEGFDRAWVEEAQSLSQRSLDLLRPTIRKEDSEIWFSWNPDEATDPVDFFFRGGEEPPRSTIVKVNCHDNPWFPQELKEEMEYDRERDNDKYLWVWEGDYNRKSESRVFNNWKVEEFETPKDAVFRFGADWGFAKDPTVLVRCFIEGRKLYIDYEAYQVGCEIVDTPNLFLTIPDSEKWPIVADSARPETISHMRKNGFPKIMPAVKGPGSLQDGVEFLKSYEIIVHPRCIHTKDELMTYSYKVDPLTDKILPVLEDKKNHVIDSLRYGCEAVRRIANKPKPSTTIQPVMSKW